MDYRAIGKRIRVERQKLNLTQEKIAEEIGISDSYYGYIERGERGLTLDNLIKIANILNVTPDFLMQESIKTDNEVLISEWLRITEGRTDKEKCMALNIIKDIFKHLDDK